MLQLSPNALTVLEKRYFHRDPESGKTVEDAEGMFWRVAKFMAEAEEPEDRKQWQEQFYDMMAELRFLPNTPCLVNAGKRRHDSGMSACFVLPIEDSMESIYSTLKDASIIIKSGGGVGYSFSNLRPKGDKVGITGGVAGGPVNFMGLFHESNSRLKQGAVRPGAQMAILHVSHPDIFDFINCKEKDKSLNSFNISVAVTDEFMKAVADRKTYDLVNPKDGKVVRTVNAREIWDEIVRMAHRTGDPGLFFVDEANKYNPTPKIGRYEATNPCGEVVLLPGEPCNLGSIVLSKFVQKDQYGRSAFDLTAIGKTVKTAVRFLDNMITMNAYPVDLVKTMALGNRKIGLGVMGWADALIGLGLPYDSSDALDEANVVMGFIKKVAYDASEDLAKERGSFPNWGSSEYAKNTEIWGPERHQRNSTKLTIAPTGSISVIADCSSGIEPHFALAYQRLAIHGKEKLFYFNEALKAVLTSIFNEEEMQEVAKELSDVGSLRRLSPRWVKAIGDFDSNVFEIYKTAYDVSPSNHVRMQAAFQGHVDSSISKTVNLRNDATVEMVEEAYLLAWESKCKGITVYRDGSRSDQVLTTGESRKEEIKPVVVGTSGSAEFKKVVEKVHGPRPRAHSLRGSTRFIPTGCGDMVVTANYDEHGMAEVIVKGGKSGGCIAAQLEAIGRLTSLALRSGVSKEKIINQLSGISCHLPTMYPAGPEKRKVVKSCGDAIAIGMIEAVADMENQIVKVNNNSVGHQGSCPVCGGTVKMESGCVSCVSPECSWSKC